MKSSIRTALLVSTMALVGAGCAQKAIENDIKADMAQTQPVQGTKQLRSEAADLISKLNLSPEKKEQLKKLQEETTQQLQPLREESLKLRSLLIKQVLSPTYKKMEAVALQKRIKVVESKKLAVMFDSVDKANGILGRETRAEQDQKAIEQMMMDHNWQY